MQMRASQNSSTKTLDIDNSPVIGAAPLTTEIGPEESKRYLGDTCRTDHWPFVAVNHALELAFLTQETITSEITVNPSTRRWYRIRICSVCITPFGAIGGNVVEPCRGSFS